ncbi:hypothetical protein D3C87_1140880 [compost metagenome]
MHQHDAVSHAHGFHLVVGDVDHRQAERALELAQFGAHLGTQLGIEVAERLVHQADRMMRDDGAGQRHALPLAARQLARLAREQLVQPEHVGGLLEPRRLLVARQLARAQAEHDVLAHAQVRKQRVRLEHHAQVALGGVHIGHVRAIEPDPPAARPVQAGNQPQQRGLAAARGAEQRDELAARHVEVDAAEHVVLAEALLQVVESQVGHGCFVGVGVGVGVGESVSRYEASRPRARTARAGPRRRRCGLPRR